MTFKLCLTFLEEGVGSSLSGEVFLPVLFSVAAHASLVWGKFVDAVKRNCEFERRIEIRIWQDLR
jgi:hypothetical protein